jgi:hypothetical protein
MTGGASTLMSFKTKLLNYSGVCWFTDNCKDRQPVIIYCTFNVLCNITSWSAPQLNVLLLLVK